MFTGCRVSFLPGEESSIGNFSAVQWLGLQAFTAKGASLIPEWGNKIPQVMQLGLNKQSRVCVCFKSFTERWWWQLHNDGSGLRATELGT